MRINRFGLEVVVNGLALPEYVKDGKTYVAAPWDVDFQLRLNVPYQGRYKAVTSVDGLDVLTGRTASANADGYIVTAASYPGANDIPGFRLNNEEVARFHFGDRRDSYAAHMDKAQNVGVIAVVFYAEYVPPPPPSLGIAPSYGAESYGIKGGGALRGGATRGGATRGASHDMGTEFGARSEHRVTYTSFRQGSEVARLVIEYASYESLVEAGVIVPHSSPLGAVNPFPADGPGCPPPPGWRG